MDYRRLGRSGLKVSALCMGTMQFGWTADEATSHKILDQAFEAGVNFIDSADVYSRWIEGHSGGEAELIVGRWMAKGPGRRDRAVLATKVRGRMGDGPNDEGLSRRHILAAVQASLRRLGTDYIDLYQLHSPDPETPIDETLEALNDLVRQGYVRYIGCSNFEAWRTVEALWASDRKDLASFVSVQPHYNLLHREEFEKELRAACRATGLGVLPYSPLAIGFLTGKYVRGVAPSPGTRGADDGDIQEYLEKAQAWDVLEVVSTVGKARGKSPSQVALAWLLSNEDVTSPIIGPRNLEQLNDNLGAVGFELGSEEMQALDRVSAWENGR